jgi:hypothetical protein
MIRVGIESISPASERQGTKKWPVCSDGFIERVLVLRFLCWKEEATRSGGHQVGSRRLAGHAVASMTAASVCGFHSVVVVLVLL